MKTIKFKALIIAALMMAGLFTACEKDNVSTTGQLKIRLTDAPFPSDLVAEANVTINKIEIRKKNKGESEGEGGKPFIILSEEEMSFNLLDLTNGITASLVDLEVGVGTYDLVRLYVSEASIVLEDGTEYDLFVPSGAQTGIKVFIKPSIEVVGGLTSDLLLDFDVSKSFVAQGDLNSPDGISGFHFKPVIKASNNSTAGSLSGMVTDGLEEPVDGVQVSIIVADTVYTTSFTDTTGMYAVLGIDAGTYSVEFAKEGYVSVNVDNVNIVAANVTIQDAVIEEEVIEENVTE